MKVSSRGEYALRALIYLGVESKNLINIEEISEKTLVPVNYLEQILLQLKRNGYVQSKRGVNGGYKLSRSPNEIIIGDVIRNLEGPLAPMGCVSITSYESCPLEVGCLLKPLWALIRDKIAELLDHTSLNDILEGNV
ncbi:Rrf2 family transcriptional regulator [Fredinandcohnia sp. QZ13]|uniref:RrF2 family transcriptional regulator n=1 Tax=Fredinandcohnia sp. QZ13 TaxID=3073144 RepID=UPI0028532867|nr:Rrf2 family transcriptional regulator [Fredinandcohnia sp. QZ13]MDR4886747.1 Rrf2 family transcriptional regulator [Fredinandcohnia sp. QZ13]